MSDPLEALRAATGGAYDHMDVFRFTCWNRHDEDCACTGSVVLDLDDCYDAGKWWPHRGPCACCGGRDARHREWDAIRDRHSAGDTIESLAGDYGVPEAAIRAVVRRAQ